MNPSTKQETVDVGFSGETCCKQQPDPNLTCVRPTTLTLANTPALVENLVINGFGGDQMGTLLLSPFIKPGSTSSTGYNHYSLLKSIEDIYHLDHIGYAADDLWTGYFLDTIGNDERIFKSDSLFKF